LKVFRPLRSGAWKPRKLQKRARLTKMTEGSHPLTDLPSICEEGIGPAFPSSRHKFFARNRRERKRRTGERHELTNSLPELSQEKFF
jgi:hypothetical protein